MSEPIDLKPLPDTDDTTHLLTEAGAFIKQWHFIAKHRDISITPRGLEDLKNDREQWLERFDRWAKNKPQLTEIPCCQ